MAPSILTVALAPVSGCMTDRLDRAHPRDCGRGFYDHLFGRRGMLRTDSHWLLPTLVIVVGAITNGIFNPANSTAMISMMPKEHRGFASAMNPRDVRLRQRLGRGIGWAVHVACFEYHTGIKTMSLDGGKSRGLRRRAEYHFMVAIVFCVVGILTSALRGAESSIGSVPGKTIAS